MPLVPDDPQPSSKSGSDLPTIRFSQRTLPNGLRVIVAPDHLAPVVAVNLWYIVGSRHETAGRSGFAHLYEHFMFQGSRHVTKAEHFSLIQAAGGVNNATTYFDRTNYFETLPSHQLDLALWLEADRMATLLDALDQENLDNQREVVKNEKRQTYDNRPYGSFYEKLMAAVFPPEHPYHHTPIGSMEDLDAATVEDVVAFFKTWYAPNNCVLSIVGDVDEEEAHAAAARYFGPIPANPSIVQPPPDKIAPIIGVEQREVVPDAVPLTRVHFGFRCPPYGSDEFDALVREALPDTPSSPRVPPAAAARAEDHAFPLPQSDDRAHGAQREAQWTQPMAQTAPVRSIFFHPQRPSSGHLLEQLRQFAGWELASGPDSADWCVLYQDATWVTLPDDDPFAAEQDVQPAVPEAGALRGQLVQPPAQPRFTPSAARPVPAA